jgi:hypothetical protein
MLALNCSLLNREYILMNVLKLNKRKTRCQREQIGEKWYRHSSIYAIVVLPKKKR